MASVEGFNAEAAKKLADVAAQRLHQCQRKQRADAVAAAEIMNTQSKRKPLAERERAPAHPSRETLLNDLMGRHLSYDTWSGTIATKRGYGVYGSAAVRFDKELLQRLDIQCDRCGAFLNPAVALQEYLEVAEKSEVHWPGRYPRALLLFQDANKMYGDSDCQLLSFSLAHARTPHQLPMQLTVGRWLSKDAAYWLAVIFRRINLVEAVRLALWRGVDGEQLRLVWAPDWKALRTVLNWCGPGAEAACPFCWAAKRCWKVAGYRRAAPCSLADFTTPLSDFLRLSESVEDIVYDPLHCCSLVLSHCVCDAIFLRCDAVAAQNPKLREDIVVIFGSLKLLKRWKAPSTEAIGQKDWTIGNNDTKAVLLNSDFWDALCSALPSGADLQWTRPVPGLNDSERRQPFQVYIRLVRWLAQDLLSWRTIQMETRDPDCRKVHLLFQALGLSPRRWSVAMHVFC